MIVLGIETSCDETSVAILSDGKILSNVVSSQIDIHKKFGGVVPEIAARHHLSNLPIVFKNAIDMANISIDQIDLISVTYGPGLIGALLVGISFAKGLSLRLGKPLIGVNHIVGHVFANYITYPHLKPPYIVLMVSGGHTEILLVKQDDEIEVLGKTVDDAAGEAFDKVARILGLGYPGGPEIDKLSKNGDENKFNFPRPMMDSKSYNFSFSGLKTAVLYTVQKFDKDNVPKEDIAASFQKAVVEILLKKTFKAAKDLNVNTIVLAGGVAANSYLRKKAQKLSEKQNIKVLIPPLEFCTDNAAMIAMAGYKLYKKGISSDSTLEAVPNLKI
ncbi:O-sialoglycoprotein endopeptidase [Thermosipho africanus TCF52B]|uniref:tRNA N6-adenosine threonylcarbamoyltransferase n=1 Tax=Thermosipho africanus (strain TCF52B) TaxID=484019 RepID=TSAD_THEAB|nr:tRNA (adenosine(37)-N6)-threonylcarbamoyltransferase complex transferase subunit TsaD [Thermosipho africanus]B7IGB4.1 RecName: Full=tRNA N6-adenosine threonylcarbamoyltransferase; AltName: Full=N6-L-threonylcarbamoyladenine synthase; Short=t(6)A synthase; AltName: Full=t(6)A37 threonylcarbamoyladenosine biosynthesis protein TsaD; AltName: Full=tRNA threonylcarbamoyladenosine biosynthesis protein TsaD [Thermosipho africanus TCF52B]ACJ75128.1 O-sialoglycoprotein endopeptidase [Thermosipho africa